MSVRGEGLVVISDALSEGESHLRHISTSGEGVKILRFFWGRHLWMAPNQISFSEMDPFDSQMSFLR